MNSSYFILCRCVIIMKITHLKNRRKKIQLNFCGAKKIVPCERYSRRVWENFLWGKNSMHTKLHIILKCRITSNCHNSDISFCSMDRLIFWKGKFNGNPTFRNTELSICHLYYWRILPVAINICINKIYNISYRFDTDQLCVRFSQWTSYLVIQIWFPAVQIKKESIFRLFCSLLFFHFISVHSFALFSFQ